MRSVCARDAIGAVAGCTSVRWQCGEAGLEVVKGLVSESERYEGLHPRFKNAFAFLRDNDLAKLSIGRYVINDDDVYANVFDVDLKKWDATAKLEVHRKYIDIQVPVTGEEYMGYVKGETNVWRNAAVFNEKDDYVLFRNEDMREELVRPGEFIVFFPPYGAHAPGMTKAELHKIRKIVVKVRA